MADNSIEGQEIVDIRKMTDKEIEDEFPRSPRGHANPPVLVLEDGTKLFPSKDPEGNGPGALFGSRESGDGPEEFILTPEK
jgi:hypothetical protein